MKESRMEEATNAKKGSVAKIEGEDRIEDLN
jgi:hypothetical protein